MASGRSRTSKSPVPSRSIQMEPAVPPRYRFHRAGSPVLRPMTTPPPFPNETARTGPKGRRAGGCPPSSGTAYAMAKEEKGWPVSLAKTTLPSAVQHKAFGLPLAIRLVDPSQVRRRAMPPATGATYISGWP